VAMLGMDVDDVRRRAAHLNALTADLTFIEAKLRPIFDDGSTWVGGDATAVDERLHAQILPALHMIREFVESTARLMITTADAQEAASSAGTGAFE
jgi:hypothetical protein